MGRIGERHVESLREEHSSKKVYEKNNEVGDFSSLKQSENRCWVLSNNLNIILFYTLTSWVVMNRFVCIELNF